MQQRIQANNSTNAAATRRSPQLAAETDEAQAAFLRNQRLNLYGNLALASGGSEATGQEAQLGLSMGVNIGTYGYQAGAGNLL